jgi:uncharacterized protein (DUF1330 family)
MNTRHVAALAALAGFGLGVIAIEGLHAQAKPPVYYVSEVDVADLEGYERDYVPKVRASVKAYGGRSLVSGQKAVAIEGDPPKRVAIVLFDSMDQLLAWRSSPQYKEDRKISDKYGTVRAFAVEALAE